MPGGKGYVGTLIEFLNHVKDEKPNREKFLSWIMVKYKLSDRSYAENVFRMLKLFGFIEEKDGQLLLTNLSEKFLMTRNKEIVLRALCEHVLGVDDILNWLCEAPMTLNDVFKKLVIKHALSWKSMCQVRQRLLWLAELNCIKRVGKKYVLTDFGRAFIKKKSLPPVRPEVAEPFEERLRKYVDEALRSIKRRPNMSEADTKSIIVEPLLELLGWNVRDIDDVEREFSVPGGKYGERVDIALKVRGKPALFIEAKAVRVDLEDKMAQQVINYAVMGNVEWCMLTNGRELRLYNAFWRVKGIEERLFMRLKLEDYVKNVDRLMLLSKESLKTGRLMEEGMQVYVSKLTSLWLRENEEKIVEEVLKMDPSVPKEKIKEAIRHIISHVS